MNFKSLPLSSHGKKFNDYYPDNNPELPSNTAQILQISQQVDAVKQAADTRISSLSQLGAILSKQTSSSNTSSSNTPNTIIQQTTHNQHSLSSGPLSSTATPKSASSSEGLGSGGSKKGGVDPNIVAATLLAQIQQAHPSSKQLQKSPILATARQTSTQISPSTSVTQRPKFVSVVKVKNSIREEACTKEMETGRSTGSPSPINSIFDPNKKRKREGIEDHSTDNIVSVSARLEDGATINMQLVNTQLKIQKTMPNNASSSATNAFFSTSIPTSSSNHIAIPPPPKGTPAAKGKPGKASRQNSMLWSGGKVRAGNRKKTDNDTSAGPSLSTTMAPLPIDASLGGDPPPMLEGDLSKIVKPANQIPITQFWGYVDQFFRDLAADDINWLKDKGYDVVAYTIPPLGRSWRETLAEQDAGIYSGATSLDVSARYEHVPDDTLLPGDAYFGPITERVLAGLQCTGVFNDPYWKNWFDSGLLDANSNNSSHNDNNNVNSPSEFLEKVKAGRKPDMPDLEDRIRRELRHLGLMPQEEQPIAWEAVDTDEITQELKKRQTELRKQVEINQTRKQKLHENALKWKAWQEYSDVLDELNKQIYAAYAKRYQKTTGKKNKSKPISSPRPLAEHTLQLLSKRRLLIEEIGQKIPAEFHSIPTKSLFITRRSSTGPKALKEEDDGVMFESNNPINGHKHDDHDAVMTDVDHSSSTIT